MCGWGGVNSVCVCVCWGWGCMRKLCVCVLTLYVCVNSVCVWEREREREMWVYAKPPLFKWCSPQSLADNVHIHACLQVCHWHVPRFVRGCISQSSADSIHVHTAGVPPTPYPCFSGGVVHRALLTVFMCVSRLLLTLYLCFSGVVHRALLTVFMNVCFQVAADTVPLFFRCS